MYACAGGIHGRTGRDLLAAAYVIHGPQTRLVWARPNHSMRPTPHERTPHPAHTVEEFVLASGGSWRVARPTVVFGGSEAAGSIAPGNMRALGSNAVRASGNLCCAMCDADARLCDPVCVMWTCWCRPVYKRRRHIGI